MLVVGNEIIDNIYRSIWWGLLFIIIYSIMGHFRLLVSISRIGSSVDRWVTDSFISALLAHNRINNILSFRRPDIDLSWDSNDDELEEFMEQNEYSSESDDYSSEIDDFDFTDQDIIIEERHKSNTDNIKESITSTDVVCNDDICEL